MKTNRGCYHPCRFPPQIISRAVRLYHRFCLNFRGVEEFLAERGILSTSSSLSTRCWQYLLGEGVPGGPDTTSNLHPRDTYSYPPSSSFFGLPPSTSQSLRQS